uniref:Uncharacterized protein n=1 Tax=Corynebacterium silvaticum TaxID=2320431 RepID=A0A7U5HLS9_9CORY
MWNIVWQLVRLYLPSWEYFAYKISTCNFMTRITLRGYLKVKDRKIQVLTPQACVDFLILGNSI